VHAPHKLSIITSLCERFAHFHVMLRALEAMHGAESTELVVVDYSSRDGDVRAALAGSPLATKYVRLPRPFRRAHGLNVGFDRSVGDSVFFTDADIIHPRTIRHDVLSATTKGSAFFPICRNLGEHVNFSKSLSGETRKPGAVGRFRSLGFGLCGFPRAAFARLRWNEKFVRWGKEDNDLWDRTRAAKIKVVRRKMPGLWHMWHPRKGYLNKNYLPEEKGAAR